MRSPNFLSRWLDRRFPLGVEPRGDGLEDSIVLFFAGVSLFGLFLLSSLGYFVGHSISESLDVVGAVTFAGSAVGFLGIKLFAKFRRSRFVGAPLYDHIEPVQYSLRSAEARLKKSGLAKDSPPALLAAEARALFNKTVAASIKTRRDLLRFSLNYNEYLVELDWGPAVKGLPVASVRPDGLPRDLIEDTGSILRSVASLRTFAEVFDRSFEASNLLTKAKELDAATSTFKASLTEVFDRSNSDDRARREIEEMLSARGNLDAPPLKASTSSDSQKSNPILSN